MSNKEIDANKSKLKLSNRKLENISLSVNFQWEMVYANNG